MSARRAAVTLCAALLFGVALVPKGVAAMPMFAKAYGLSCSACHTMVPALNAYGRYVQRTGYASLKRDVLKTVPPIWIGEQVNGDSNGGVSSNNPNDKYSFGNLAIHGAGYVAPDWTFHVQQWLLENDAGGGSLDTAWVTYNNLLHRDGHLFIGKYEARAPSPFSQWFDISAFTSPEITVGEHPYQLDGNRWGAKFAYVHASLDAELGWLGSSNGMIGGADFATTAGTDKTWQWKLASASGDRPFEGGVYGSAGSYIVSTGDVDRYHSYAAYVQNDPSSHGMPGIFATYQLANDANPGLDPNGLQLGSATSHATMVELYEPLFKNNALIGVRNEFTNDGLGNAMHSGNIDFAFNVPRMPYIHGYIEAGLGTNSTTPNATPEWRWMLWWTTPVATK